MNKVDRAIRVVIVGGLATGILVIALEVLTLDGVNGLSPFIGDSDVTIYAPKYTDGAFRSIHVGMTREEVLDALGEPFLVKRTLCIETPFVSHNGRTELLSDRLPQLDRFQVFKERWNYTKRDVDKSYRMRGVEFVQGRVSKVIHHFEGD